MKLVTGRRVVLGDDDVGPASIAIEDGKIVNVWRVYRCTDVARFDEVTDAGDLVVMPGVVDSHVHVNEPGRTAWEGFRTATRAAAAGGITTVVDMPLNCIPPTTSVEALRTKQQHAQHQCYVDVAFWGGVVPGNKDELRPMIDAGVCGFKCFMIHSGVDEFRVVEEVHMCEALQQLQGTGSVLLFHAEVETGNTPIQGDPTAYSTFLASRPDCMEVEAVTVVAKLCQRYGVRCHIVHLSSAEALPVIRSARAAAAPLSVETTHHYLTLNSNDIPDGATQYKCCPPIRNSVNQEKLWAALQCGDIDMVVSDHSPCTADLKLLPEGDFVNAWGGIASLQFGLPLFWTFGRKRGASVSDVTKYLCQRTAQLCQLGHRKGAIRVGYDADLVIWDPEQTFKVTPYAGMELCGVVKTTILRGEVVYKDGVVADPPTGRIVSPPHA